MSERYKEAIKSIPNIAISTGSDLTAWRNGDVKLAVGELQACDIPLKWSNDPPELTSEPIGQMTTSRVPMRHTSGSKPGEWKSTHFLQTAQFIYWIMQKNTTTGASAPYTHTMATPITSTPINLAIHHERKDTTAQKDDLLGLCPEELVIRVDNKVGSNFEAKQEIKIKYAVIAAGDALTAQTPRPITTGYSIKTWDHAIRGNCAGHNPSGFTYNTAMGVDINAITITLKRGVLMAVPDTSGYYTVGSLGSVDFEIELDVTPLDDGCQLFAINQLKLEDYTQNLNYTFKLTADAANDDIEIPFTNLYMEKFQEKNSYGEWYEKYTIKLVPGQSTTGAGAGIVPVGIDSLADTAYANP